MSAEARLLPPALRSMRPTDIGAVAGIERASYEFPWSAGIFRDCLLAGYTNVVLEQDSQIVGYGILSVAAGEAHLLNLCLAEHVRGVGYGRHLLNHLMQLARDAGAERMFLEVRPSNQPALRLYRAAGFGVVGMRRGYYRARWGKEDAVVLVSRLG